MSSVISGISATASEMIRRGSGLSGFERASFLLGITACVPLLRIADISLFLWLILGVLVALAFRRSLYFEILNPFLPFLICAFVSFIHGCLLSLPPGYLDNNLKGIINLVAIYLVACSLFRMKGKTCSYQVVRGVVLAGKIQVVWIFIQVFSWNVLSVDINNLVFNEYLDLTEKTSQFKGSSYIPTGLCWNAGGIAASLVIGLMLEKKLVWKIAFLAAGLCTQSRTIAIALVIGAAVCLISGPLLSGVVRKKWAKVAAIFVATFSALFLIAVVWASMKTGGAFSASAMAHLGYYINLPALIEDMSVSQLLVGYGINCSGFPYTALTGQYHWLSWFVESDITNTFLSFGLVGAFFFGVWYAFLFRNSWHFSKRISALFAVLLITGVFYNVHSVTYFWLIFVEMALLKIGKKPTARRELVEELGGTNLGKGAMKILIVSEYIAPVRSIASIRWTKLGKYMASDTVKVDILTNEKSYSEGKLDGLVYPYDESTEKDLAFFSAVHTVPDSLFLRVACFCRSVIRSKKDRQQSGAKTNENDRAINPSWKKSFAKDLMILPTALRKYVKLASGYDVIISTYGPAWPHLFSEAVKKANPSIVWLADYRDQPSNSTHGRSAYLERFAQNHTSSADRVLMVAEEMAEYLGLEDSSNCVYLPNGFDFEEEHERERRPSDYFDLVYTGTMYSSKESRRDVTPLFAALDLLIREGKIDGSKIRVRYAGWQDSVFLSQAASFPSVPAETLGLLSRSEALELQRCASLLILLTWNTSKEKGVATGKIYEYFASGTPIVCICSGDKSNSLAKKMLERTRSGFCFEEANAKHDARELADYIETKYCEWVTAGITSCDAVDKEVMAFSYSTLAKSVLAIIEKALEDSRNEK